MNSKLKKYISYMVFIIMILCCIIIGSSIFNNNIHDNILLMGTTTAILFLCSIYYVIRDIKEKNTKQEIFLRIAGSAMIFNSFIISINLDQKYGFLLIPSMGILFVHIFYYLIKFIIRIYTTVKKIFR